ncbi:hypothetical protein [Halomonas marinisediminis]|uniref:Uncharacterized protein n=1 Tax=Halomonas marinisediminis TaxID=2546095 RepID=A0ABY2D622_9GAMM|nr:hypothetical protein [Halomonas marinisediminis]TDB02212.1 hypothetical protein E0702_10090 [Halomonas marinisediminis]
MSAPRLVLKGLQPAGARPDGMTTIKPQAGSISEGGAISWQDIRKELDSPGLIWRQAYEEAL